MMKHTAQLPLHSIALAVLALLASPLTQAQCGCPSDKNGAPANPSIGLGQAFPEAPDLSIIPGWKVYQFDRDGIRYVQINDLYGNVRAAVGMIGSTTWVLPVGKDADRVTTSQQTPAGIAYKLYTSQEVEVTLYQDGTQVRWAVRAQGSTN